MRRNEPRKGSRLSVAAALIKGLPPSVEGRHAQKKMRSMLRRDLFGTGEQEAADPLPPKGRCHCDGPEVAAPGENGARQEQDKTRHLRSHQADQTPRGPVAERRREVNALLQPLPGVGFGNDRPAGGNVAGPERHDPVSIALHRFSPLSVGRPRRPPAPAARSLPG
jgi:hypothetical protein